MLNKEILMKKFRLFSLFFFLGVGLVTNTTFAGGVTPGCTAKCQTCCANLGYKGESMLYVDGSYHYFHPKEALICACPITSSRGGGAFFLLNDDCTTVLRSRVSVGAPTPTPETCPGLRAA